MHSDGSLADLSEGRAPQLLSEQEPEIQEKDKTEEKCIKEETDEYSCMFDRESVSDCITGKHTCSHT